VFNDWHVVIDAAPDAAELQLKQALGTNGIRCVCVPLEELFIELVGGQREKEAE